MDAGARKVDPKVDVFLKLKNWICFLFESRKKKGRVKTRQRKREKL